MTVGVGPKVPEWRPRIEERKRFSINSFFPETPQLLNLLTNTLHDENITKKTGSFYHNYRRIFFCVITLFFFVAFVIFYIYIFCVLQSCFLLINLFQLYIDVYFLSVNYVHSFCEGKNER